MLHIQPNYSAKLQPLTNKKRPLIVAVERKDETARARTTDKQPTQYETIHLLDLYV